MNDAAGLNVGAMIGEEPLQEDGAVHRRTERSPGRFRLSASQDWRRLSPLRGSHHSSTASRASKASGPLRQEAGLLYFRRKYRAKATHRSWIEHSKRLTSPHTCARLCRR